MNGDRLASEGKLRVERGDRLDERPVEGRLWFCRTCGAQKHGRVIPAGWYALARHPGIPEERPYRLGIYCSLDCLGEQMPRLQGVGEQIGAAWRDSPYRQRPS